jgi:hypothetical protein
LGIGMATAATCAALTVIVISGCVTPPEAAREQRSSSRSAQTPPQTQRPFSNALEERHQAQAQAHAREGNWADALVHWELLALLRPESTAYRDAVATTRKQIRDAADSLIRRGGAPQRQCGSSRTVIFARTECRPRTRGGSTGAARYRSRTYATRVCQAAATRRYVKIV